MPRASYDDPPAELLALGTAVRSLRESRGFKQIELASAAGMTESQISDIERGKNNSGWLLVMRLLGGLEMSLGEFSPHYERAKSEFSEPERDPALGDEPA